MNDDCKDCIKRDVCRIREDFEGTMRKSHQCGISNSHPWNSDGATPLTPEKKPKTIAGIISCVYRGTSNVTVHPE